MSRILRSLVCLLLICCILVNFSPLEAQATGLEVALPVAGGIVVSPAGVVIGATLVALGLYAAADPEGFENIKNAATDALEAAGTWVKDGTVELLRMVDELGNASYYVDSGLMEDVRSWLFEEGSLVVGPSVSTTNTILGTTFTADKPVASFAYRYNNYGNVRFYYGVCSYEPFYCSYPGGQDSAVQDTLSINGTTFYWYGLNGIYTSTHANAAEISTFPLLGSGSDFVPKYHLHNFLNYSGVSTSLDVALGQVSTVPIDGTSARQWSEDYTDRGLKVYGGGSGNNNNDGKWFWKLMLPLTAADLLLMSQADEWSGETPKEFDDYTTVEELEIVSRPEVEFGQGLELAPVTSPSPDPGTGTNPGTGTDPDPGTNPGTNPNPGTDPDPGTGTDPTPDSGSSGAPSKDMEFFALDLKEFFPFCIPFDLYDFFTCLNADPVAPVIEWVIPLPGGDTYPLELDLSTFDPVAQLLRRLQLLLFCVGLAFKTRDLIKG